MVNINSVFIIVHFFLIAADSANITGENKPIEEYEKTILSRTLKTFRRSTENNKFSVRTVEQKLDQIANMANQVMLMNEKIKQKTTNRKPTAVSSTIIVISVCVGIAFLAFFVFLGSKIRSLNLNDYKQTPRLTTQSPEDQIVL